MATLQENVTAAVTAAKEATAGEDVAVKAAAVSAAATAAGAVVPPPPPKIVSALWLILVGGLVLILLSALGGIIWSVVDGKTGTERDVLVTVFSSVLTGLLGLFVKSPNT